MASTTFARNALILSVVLGLALANPLPQVQTQSTDTTEVPLLPYNVTYTSPSLDEIATLKVVTPVGAECYLMGNTNLYPLGLRVGVYLQWFATIFANFFVPAVARRMRGLNTLFQLGIFGGLCYSVTNLPTLDGLEAFILLTLCVGSINALITSPNMNVRVTRLGSISRLVVFLAVFVFGAWFWFSGVNELARTGCTQQIQFLFFWKVHLYHWFKQFSEAVMIISAVSVLTALVWELFQFSTVFRSLGAKSVFFGILDGTLCKDSILGGILLQEKYAWVSGALLVIVFTVMAAFIVTVEGALKHSGASYVFTLESPTELIPFVIGMFSLANVSLGMAMSTMRVVNQGRSLTPEDKEMGSRPSTGHPM